MIVYWRYALEQKEQKAQEGIICLAYLKERLLYLKQGIFFYFAVLVSVLCACVHVCMSVTTRVYVHVNERVLFPAYMPLLSL